MDNRDIIALILGVILGVFFMTLVSLKTIKDMEWHRDIVKHKAGYYHPDTGKFTWRDQNGK